MLTTTDNETALANAAQPGGYTMAFARQLATSGLIPKALQGKPADVLVVLLTGRELGLQPMQALRSIHVVDGKPVLSADMMVALCVRERAVCEWIRVVESSDAVATYEAKRVGCEPVRLSFSIEQARAAGLAGKDNWRKYSAAMLRARCAAAIARAVFPDLVAGIYEPDELDAPAVAPVPTPPPPAPVTLKRVEPAPVEAAPTEEPPPHDPDTGELLPAEPPAEVALPAGPPEPRTEAYDRWFESEIAKCSTRRELSALAAQAKGKVLQRDALNFVFLKRQGELNRAGAH